MFGTGGLLLLVAGVWLGTQLTGGRDAPERTAADAAAPLPYQAGPYRLDVRVTPEAPVVGENRLRIVLRDAAGEPVRQAQIRAVAEMPAMGAMPAMQAPAQMREVSPGVYEGKFELAMRGGWPLTVRIEAPGLPVRTLGFDMATGRPGLTPAAGLDGGGEGARAGAEHAPPGTVTVDARRRQLIGLTLAQAEVRSLTRSIRAVGRVAVDERLQTDVSLKYPAWIGELHADFVGAPVKRGAVLFTVYSPELYAAQQEYLETRKRGLSADLLAAARQRLEFWDVDERFIRELERRGKPLKYVPIRAPRDGVVVMKDAVEGTAQPAGKTLLRIADLDRVWIEAEIYEADLSLVEVGMPAAVTLPYLPERQFSGRVEYIYPYLDQQTRTGRVRLTLDNPEGALKPDMFADVKLQVELSPRLAVPESAVLVSGETRVVFEDIGEGRLAPRIVETGWRAGGWVEILSGLEAGDRVVTSGNFLIASESRLKAGIKQW